MCAKRIYKNKEIPYKINKHPDPLKNSHDLVGHLDISNNSVFGQNHLTVNFVWFNVSHGS